MRRLWHGLSLFYSNLRIKYKLFLLICVLMLGVSGISITVLQYAFDVYDDQIYQEAAKSLQLSSSGIESELNKIEKMSYRISTDEQLQSHLHVVATAESAYMRYRALVDWLDLLTNYGAFDKYILSTHLYDTNNQEYSRGVNIRSTSPERIEEIIRLAKAENGGVSWIYPNQLDSALTIVREVRGIQNSNFLEHLGTIAIRVDMKGLQADYARGLSSSGARFLIVDNNGRDIIYPEDTADSVKETLLSINGSQGYKTVEIEDSRYFMTYIPSNYLRWLYITYIPYNNIFLAISAVKNTVWIMYVVLTLLAILAAIRFSRGITRPIESLNTKMKKVQFGDFDYELDQSEFMLHMDESGQLHRNFRIMVGRINELIRENYLKQLTIKESEFKALQAQINPHFLYNTLESINWLAKMDGQQQISKMVESLGFLFRSSINLKAPLISLKDELEIVRNYITIQAIRFEERLDFVIDVPVDFSDCLVPKLSLQPIVENSINYGLEHMLETCTIQIIAKLEDTKLHVIVCDNGPGMDPEQLMKLRSGELKSRGSGLGLRNIDERIKLLFGEAYGLTVDSVPGEGTEVTLILPMKTEDDDV
jgi:two-component system sensor histidine kinase YesM